MAANYAKTAPEIRISGDSHVAEPLDLWENNIQKKFRDRALTFPRAHLGTGHDARPGGADPVARLRDEAADGVSAELLFPTRGNDIWRQFYQQPVDVELSTACERVYNDWMIDYCSTDPDRLWGQGVVSLYDVDYAVKEIERCKSAGLKGVCTWVAPPDELPWTSDHYERFWAAAENLEMPIGMHINAGFGPYVLNNPNLSNNPLEVLARQTYSHKYVAMKTVAELILSGVFERHPRAKLLLAEFEVGWIPFFLEDMDRKAGRGAKDVGLSKLPSEYFAQSIYSTFIQDGVGGYLMNRWGADNFIYSNDYPHPGGIWPHSDETVELTMGGLPKETRRKVLGETMCSLYRMPLPKPVEREEPLDWDEAIWKRPFIKSPKDFTFDKPKFGLAL